MSVVDFIVAAALVGGCVVVSVSAMAEADPAQSAIETEKRRSPWLWGPQGDLSLWSVVLTRKDDVGGEELDGVRLEVGRWDERPDSCEFGCMTGGFWASRQAGELQRVYGGGMDLGILILPLGPVRVFPRLKVGIEYREQTPDDGFGGLAGIGLEGGVWLRDRVFLSVKADREFAWPSGTSNQVAVALGIGVPEFRWWPEE